MSKKAPKTGNQVTDRPVRIGITFANNDVLQNLLAEQTRTGIKVNTLIKVLVAEKYGHRTA